MSSFNQKIARYYALWISDLHLGSQNCKAQRLRQFLEYNEAEHLYLVGGIFDGWKMKLNLHWTPDHSSVVRAVLAKTRQGTKVHYLTSHHEQFIREFTHDPLRLGLVQLADEVVHKTLDGRRLLVTHGESFDDIGVRVPLLARVGNSLYEMLKRSDPWTQWIANRIAITQQPLSAFAKSQVKAAVQRISRFDKNLESRCKLENLQGVIHGYTHRAEIRPLGSGIISYNCGDWVDSCTALAEDFSGQIRMLDDTGAVTAAGRLRTRGFQAQKLGHPGPGAGKWCREGSSASNLS